MWDADDVTSIEVVEGDASGYALTLTSGDVEPLYTVETAAYVPGAVFLTDETTPLASGEGHYPEPGEHLLLPVTGACELPLCQREVA